MAPFVNQGGGILTVNGVNVDTDQIIPAVFLKSIERSGFQDALLSSCRYNTDGTPNPDFVLNKPAYKNANSLVAGPNFGW